MSGIISTAYQLTEPYVIKSVTAQLSDPGEYETLVQPVISGICGSDLSYFFGKKNPEKLKKRLPVALLHEGIVRAVDTKILSVVIPLQSCKICPVCIDGNCNLCPNALFMGSTGPGLSRTLFYYPTELLLPFPSGIDPRVVAITEPLTIAYSFTHTLGNLHNERIAVIGNGSLAYFTVVMLATVCHVAKERLFVIGINEEKLRVFDDLATTILSRSFHGQKLQTSLIGSIDLGIEAVGGDAMITTVNTLISFLKPGGRIALFGLSDILIPVNLIEIVNKGLKLQGFSRSTMKDYHAVLTLMSSRDFQEKILRIINPRIFPIASSKDLVNAFHFASAGKHSGKVLVSFSSL